MTDRTAANLTPDSDPEAIFRELKTGLGHELVTDANVDAIIDVAKRHGHQLLEQELREWRSPCGERDGALRTSEPRPTFNKANAKH